jgi:hypothetical protein
MPNSGIDTLGQAGKPIPDIFALDNRQRNGRRQSDKHQYQHERFPFLLLHDCRTKE